MSLQEEFVNSGGKEVFLGWWLTVLVDIFSQKLQNDPLTPTRYMRVI